MSSVNKAILIGNLGRDPEMRYTQSGDAIANFSIATSETWKDKNTGEKKEATEWHRCVAYQKLAEIIGEYVKKGSKIYVEGSLKTRKWTDNNGVERYTTEVRVDQMKMLSGKPDGGQRPPEDEASQESQHHTPSSSRPAQNRPKPSFDDLGDDIPF